MEMGSLFLFFAIFTSGSMGFVDIEEFFPNVRNNLTEVVWAHAVNNATYLNQTLSDKDVMMIEADVQMGTPFNNPKVILPIMAHPPNNVSDLTLEMFLQKIEDHNKVNRTDISRKGVKLDFKQIAAFTNSVELLRLHSKKSNNYPLWINADILRGNHSNNTVLPVNASQFLEGAKEFESAWLSIGWTTAGMTTQYSDENIDEMIGVLKQQNPKNRITFPVRANLAAKSIKQMENLLEKTKNSTLTIWSSEGDSVNVDLLRVLIGKIGVNKLFIDVPNDLKSKLRLNDLPTPNSAITRFATSLPIFIITLVLFL